MISRTAPDPSLPPPVAMPVGAVLIPTHTYGTDTSTRLDTSVLQLHPDDCACSDCCRTLDRIRQALRRIGREYRDGPLEPPVPRPDTLEAQLAVLEQAGPDGARALASAIRLAGRAGQDDAAAALEGLAGLIRSGTVAVERLDLDARQTGLPAEALAVTGGRDDRTGRIELRIVVGTRG